MTQPTAEDELIEQVLDLELKLQEKEQLVAVLTERLEQAAEQLDRLHRTGADRKRGSGGGGGLPPELIEQQKSLVEEMQRAVEQWEDMQTAAQLGRIEIQVTELRGLLTEHLSHERHLGSPLGMAVSSPQGVTGSAEEADASTESGWDLLKAQLLSAAAVTEETVGSQPDGPGGETEETALESADAPQPISFETATREQLEAAIKERDNYIAHLLRKLRTAPAADVSPDWSALQAPAEMVERVQALERQLEERLRMTEVELSLERARIARDQTQLQQQQEQLEKQMRRMGLRKDGEQEPDHPADDNPDRRWLRFLGRNRHDKPE